MRHLYRFAIAAALLFAIVSCGGTRNFVQTPDQTVPTSQALNLSLSFPNQVNPSQVKAQTTTSLQSLRVSLFLPDGDLAVGPFQIKVPQPLPQPWLVTVPEVPLNQELVLRLEALDGAEQILFDLEQLTRFIAPVPTIELGLSSTQDTVSAAFYLVPNLQLETEASQELAARFSEELAAEQFTLVDERFLLYPPSPAAGWRVELGNQTGTINRDGRLRMPRPDPSVTQGQLVHPSSPEITVPFNVADLSDGQVAKVAFGIRLPFAGPCGMDDRTAGEEFCDGTISFPENSARAVAVLLQSTQRASLLTSNDCDHVVPEPTETRILPRGRYPDPSQLVGGNEVFVDCHSQCEQLNGFISPDNDVTNAEGTTEISYIGSVCFRYVRFGCCPNENTLSDIEGAVATPGQAVVQAITGLASYVVDIPTIEVVDATVDIDSDTSCMDNHKGRECQNLFIGDVSLDFTQSRRGPIVKPNSPETVIQVEPGETIEFILHNNGCFGVTDATVTKQEIAGVLARSFKEQAIAIPANSNQSGQRKLALSTDPLLGGVPTTGRYTGFTTPSTSANVTPVGVGTFGIGAGLSQIEHFLIDSAVENKKGRCERYRYFPDLAMTYRPNTQAQPGSQDRFVFTVDECAVPITFEIVAPGTFPPDPTPTPSTSLSPTPTPTPSPTDPPPSDLINVNPLSLVNEHIVTVSPCPQLIGEIAIGNVVTDAVSATVQATSPLFVDSPNINLTGGTGAALVGVFFDCSTTSSFSQIVTIRAERADGSFEVVEVPVTVNIRFP